MAKRKFKEVNFERPKPRKRPGRHTKRPNKKYTKKKIEDKEDKKFLEDLEHNTPNSDMFMEDE